MAKYSGRQVDIGFARETARGTWVTPAYWTPRTDLTFDSKVNKFRVQSGVGTLEDSEQTHIQTKWSEGELTAEVRDKSFGLMLYSLFGACTTTGPIDSAYTHAFSLADSAQHQSLSLTVVDPNTTERYSLAMLNTLELKQELNGVLSYTASFMSKTGKAGSATPSYVVENKFTKKHLSFKIADTIANLATATAISVKSLTLTFNQNVVADDFLGTAEPEDFLNRSWSCEGKFTLNYESEVYKEYMRNNTSRTMEIKWTGDTLIGVTAVPILTFQFPKVDFYDWTPNYALDEIVSQEMTFKANRDLTNGLAAVSTCTLVNAVTSY